MTPDQITELGRRAIEVTLLLSAPMLISALVVGLAVSIFQAVTQINEQTLSFIPKIVAMLLVLLLSGPWMLDLCNLYVRELYESIPLLVSQET